MNITQRSLIQLTTSECLGKQDFLANQKWINDRAKGETWRKIYCRAKDKANHA